jgi:tetratricopeptide (TPR) repeat protein
MAAESLLGRAIDLEPENSDFHFELGSLYVERGHLERARQEFEQTLMIQPSHLPARYNLGLVYRELGFMSEARSEFRKVLELDPSNVKAQLQIGYIYQAEGFIEEARQAFERAHEMDPLDQEPEDALEDLAEWEAKLHERSLAETNRSFQRNQRYLYNPNSPLRSPYRSESGLAPNPQLSQKDALVQAGMFLIQELMAKRAQARSENEE